MSIRKTILISTLGFFITACEDKVVEVEKIYRPVQYVKVMPQGGEVKQTFSGIVEAGLDAQLSFRVAGTIAKRHVKLGDNVRSGQLLFSLDATDYQVAVQQAKASLQQAQANQRNNQANYERVIELYENNNASKSDLDAARAGAESAKAATEVAQKQFESAQLQFSYTQIKSPHNCSVAEILSDTNEAVAAGQGVVRINCGQCEKVKVSIPEQFIRLIQTNDLVKVSTTTDSNKVYSAVITEVGVAASTRGAFPVEALLEEGCDDLRSGMTANLQFDFSKQLSTLEASQLFVPYLSVGEDQKGHYLFVLSVAEKDIYNAEKRRVVLGEKAQNGVQILEGLKQGELVATAGVRRLLDGMQVKLLKKPILGNY